MQNGLGPAEAALVLDDLRRIVRSLRESSRAAERSLGVSGAQLFALSAIARTPGMSLNDVAVVTRTHQSTVSVVVKRLLTAKLVSRDIAADDARRVELAPTKAGLALLARAPLAAQERLIRAVEQMPRKRGQELALALRRLVEAMQLDAEPAVMFFEEDTPPKARPRQKTKARRRAERSRHVS
jgi:DNA-binding MarR family transcriptional regulator